MRERKVAHAYAYASSLAFETTRRSGRAHARTHDDRKHFMLYYFLLLPVCVCLCARLYVLVCLAIAWTVVRKTL